MTNEPDTPTPKTVWDPADLFVALMLMFVAAVCLTLVTISIKFVQKPIMDNYFEVILLGVGLTYLLKKYPVSSSELGFTAEKIAKVMIVGLLCGLVISLPNIAHLNEPIIDVNTTNYVPRTDGKFAYYNFIIFSVIIIPIGEELLFRGCIYRILKNRFNVFLAVAITSVIFALGHFDIKFALFSFILIAGYEFSKSLGTCIVAHVLWNWVYYFRLYVHLGT